jgi:hypothetical protein
MDGHQILIAVRAGKENALGASIQILRARQMSAALCGK